MENFDWKSHGKDLAKTFFKELKELLFLTIATVIFLYFQTTEELNLIFQLCALHDWPVLIMIMIGIVGFAAILEKGVKLLSFIGSFLKNALIK